ncbi:MAG: hypothetical protein LUG52_03165 [Clostridia bacterium]|nr:hypothetical protein [Clostridia bacterium]
MDKEAKKMAILSLVLDAAVMIVGVIGLSVFIDEFKSGAARSLMSWTSSYKEALQLLNVILIGWILIWFIQLLVLLWKCQRSMRYTNEHVKSIDEQIASGNFVKCGVCSSAVPVETGVCPRCGELFTPKIAEKRNTGLKYCGQCGTALKENELYCTKCGNKLV